MSDADVLANVMRLERKKEALKKASIDEALKARLMHGIVEELEALTRQALSSVPQAKKS